MPALLAGSHLIVGRDIYIHHGIYVGHDQLIHYSGIVSWYVVARTQDGAWNFRITITCYKRQNGCQACLEIAIGTNENPRVY